MSILADRVVDTLAAHGRVLYPAIKQLMEEAWAEGAEAYAEWLPNQSTPSGVPTDPPANPYTPTTEQEN